jgi:GT2 family glycosyltransferase
MNRRLLAEKYFKFPFNHVLSLLQTNETFLEFDFDKISLSLSEDQTQVISSERTIKYSCTIDIGDISGHKDNIIIIPVKDNPILLEFCLDNIFKNDINRYCDILVIDDRSSSEENHLLCLNKRVSHCKALNTDNSFNYSVLTNIGASYAKLLGKKRILFWNNDLWANNPDTVKELLKFHIANNSSITGTRLIYPDQSQYKSLGISEHVLGKQLDNSYNTIQHGGIVFIPFQCLINPKVLMFMPSHQWRFFEPDHDLASIDQRCLAVTGALHIVNTEDFLNLGGYGCSLATSYQDIDLCQRAVQQKLAVYYVGSQSMLHAETITNKENHMSISSLSDRLLYEYVWQPQIQRLLGIAK